MPRPRILIACEFSGVVRDAFRLRGFDAVSCDLLQTESPGPHYKGDVRDILDDGWDAIIAHPDCTYLCCSGLHWNKRQPGRALKTDMALEFVEELWRAPIRFKALENPQGCINTRLAFMPKPQYIQPHQFGHDASKKTGLWLDGLPPLKPTVNVRGRIVVCNGREVMRWANQTDSGQNRESPGPDRWKIRAATYLGVAEAMANQWGSYISAELGVCAA